MGISEKNKRPEPMTMWNQSLQGVENKAKIVMEKWEGQIYYCRY